MMKVGGVREVNLTEANLYLMVFGHNRFKEKEE